MAESSATKSSGVAAGWAALRRRPELRGEAWSSAAAALVEPWLAGLLAEACGGDAKGLALIGVGSLGRGELAPGSDLDLLLVHENRKDVKVVADALWYPIWDEPMPMDHSVRTIAQVQQAAEGDLRVSQGLLDARLMAGDPSVAERLGLASTRLWEKRARKWLPQLDLARRDRHATYGDVAFMLEPDLQEGRGGLRDLQLLHLMNRVTPVVRWIAEDPRLAQAHAALHRVRIELQRPSGRRSDRMALEDKDRVAEALGIEGGRDELARLVSEAARAVAWLTDDAWRRVESWVAGPRGRGGSADRPLGPGLVLRDGEVAVTASAQVESDPTLPLRAATAAAQMAVPLAHATLDRLQVGGDPLPEPWPPELTRAFVALLGTGRSLIPAVEALDQLGVWVRYFPEWERIRNRPQHNPYHRWTVDRHLLEAVAAAAGQLRSVRRPDLLLLGTLLHDIGKGLPGDHSEAGVAVAAGVADRLGLVPDDRDVLLRLVRHHLLLSDVSTRRDLDDPLTVAAVAEVVTDVDTLELLAGLSASDGQATGPSAWTPWRQRLLQELVSRTAAVLTGSQPAASEPFPTAEHRRLMAEPGVHLRPAGEDIVLVAPDRPGLLSLTAGVLALRGVGVLDARVHSEGGVALQVFRSEPTGEERSWSRIQSDMRAAIEGRLDLGSALDERWRQDRRRVLALPVPEIRLVTNNEAATSATVVEVRAPDGRGVLYRITRAMAGLGLDIISAHMVTLGNAVVDTFYVCAGDRKLTGSQISELEQAVAAALGAEIAAASL
jgi:[protein-PII] uridylyltransferase